MVRFNKARGSRMMIDNILCFQTADKVRDSDALDFVYNLKELQYC